MELYLVQHAESKSKEVDQERGLSDLGFANIRKVAEYAKKLNLSVDAIFHSDKLRAKQTASELSKTVKLITGLIQRDGIAPMDDINLMEDEVNKCNKNLMIVGHLPYLDKLASALLCGKESSNVVNFQYGCIVKLERKNGEDEWSLKWMITPEIC